MASTNNSTENGNINDFLMAVHSDLKRNIPTADTINIILGNPSCDLDSATSAIVYSLYLKWKQDRLQSEKETHLFIPVFNIQKKDIYLKTEVDYYLSKQNIDLELLIFRDDINLQEMANMYKSKFKLILVDHHILASSDSNLEKFVTKIIDHRPIDTQKWKYDESNLKWRIEQVASCATLICSEIIEATMLLFLETYLDCVTLLYGTIVVDSVNLLPAAGRAKKLDIEIIDILENVLNVEQGEEYRMAIFSSIVKAKTDISKLSPLQLLNKDCKLVGDIPIPSVPILVKDFLKLKNVFDAIETFLEDRHLKITVILGFKPSDTGIDRDLAIYFQKHLPFIDELIARLTDNTEVSLELDAVESPRENLLLYRQNNVKASRKQILPIISQFYEDLKYKL